MQNLKINELNKIFGGTQCFCIQIYMLTPIPTPLTRISTQASCKESCCSGDDLRFEFNGVLFNCYEDQQILNLTNLIPPQDEEIKESIEQAKEYAMLSGKMLDKLHDLASLMSY